jgi:[acyl-carrier-protein] S-malonyltransferase
MPYCLIFPGQGTQFPGMSAGLDLGWIQDEPVKALAEKGPEDELRQTVNAQKAIYAVTASLWERTGLDAPAAVMGHSLGEYMALTAAGAFSLSQGYALVAVRARLMQEAMPPGAGAMAAVLEMPLQEIERLVPLAGKVWVANINCDGQVVISGEAAAVERASELLKENGAKRVMPLNVAVASHCPLMEPAARGLEEHLGGVEVSRPEVPVIFNTTARQETDPGRIKGLLARQLVSPVQWKASVEHVLGMGIERFIEIGPRPVLASLVRRIAPRATVEVLTADAH